MFAVTIRSMPQAASTAPMPSGLAMSRSIA
jgi:hypothetical protein